MLISSEANSHANQWKKAYRQKEVLSHQRYHKDENRPWHHQLQSLHFDWQDDLQAPPTLKNTDNILETKSLSLFGHEKQITKQIIKYYDHVKSAKKKSQEDLVLG